MCTIIDLMHDLLLDTAKHVMDTWKRLSVIDSKNYRKELIVLFPLLILVVSLSRLRCRAVEKLGGVLFTVLSQGCYSTASL